MRYPWTGYFINLDRSRDRRASIEHQLQRCGLSHLYSRFPAVDGTTRTTSTSRLTSGAIGCFESHAAVLDQANLSSKFVHILEDDALIPKSFAGHVERLMGSSEFRDFDIIYTDVSITARGYDYENLRKLKAGYDAAMSAKPDIGFKFINLFRFPFCGTISYFVTPAGFDKVRSLVHNELKNGGPSLEIDLLYQREINGGHLRAACIFPFITSVQYDHASASTITARGPNTAARLARRMARYSFFVDCDLSAANAILAPLTAQRANDRHLNSSR